jgi:flagellin
MQINNNITAMRALRHLNFTSENLNKTLSRLSSGLKIVSAADDPAGLIISEQLRSQISSLKAASRNASEADQYFGIAESALDEVNRMLVDMRALAIHAANGATSDDQRTADDLAFQNAVTSIGSVLDNTRYAGTIIFDNATKDYLIGEESTDTVSFQMLDLATERATLESSDLTSQANASTAIDNIDTFQGAVSLLRGNIGAYQQNVFQSRERTLAVQVENVAAAESNIRDANIAEETTNFTKWQILTQAGVAVLAQANVISQSVLQLLG